MILERIEFKNFKRYSDETINFSDGITGIIGNNGSGKSTIVQGILFALYGVRAGIEGDFINSSGSESKEKCSVTLEFLKDGNKYNITRWYRRTPSTVHHEAQLRLNDTLLADSVSQVEKEVARIIGMQASDFRNTIYAGQKDLSSLLDESPAERQKWFMKMLGIDFLKKEADAGLKTQIDDCRAEISGLESYLGEKEKENLSEKINLADSDMRTAEKSLEIIRSETAALVEEEERLKKTADDLSGRWKKYQELERDIEYLKETNSQKAGYISKLNEKVRKFELLLPEFEKPAKSEENYSAIKKDYLDYRDKEKLFSGITAAIEKLKYQLESEKQGLKDTEHRICSLEEDKKRYHRILPEISRRNYLLEELKALKRSEAEFRILNDKRIRIQEKLKHYRDQAALLRENIETGEVRLKKLEYSDDTDSLIKKLAEDENRLSEETVMLREGVKTLEREGEKFEKELLEITSLGEDGECPKCKRRLGEQYEVLESSLKTDIELNARRIEELMKKIPANREELDSVRKQLERFKELKKESEKIIALIEDKKTERQDLFRKVEGIIEEENRISEEIEKNSFSEARIREVEDSVSALEAVYDEYRRIEERLKEESILVDRKAEIDRKISEFSLQIKDERSKLSGIGFDPEKFRLLEKSFEEAERLHQLYLELKPKIDQIPSIKKETSEIENEIKSNMEKISDIESSIKSMDISEEIVKKTLSDVEECRKKINEKGIAGGKIENSIEFLKNEIRRLEIEIFDIEEKKKRHSDLQNRMVVLEKTRGLIKEYIIYLLNVIRAKIEGEVGRVLSEITGGRYQNVLIDENFDVLVNDLGENYPARRFSGGEQDDIAIALRIALSRYLAEMHRMSGGTFMIFDEIFGSQDEERRSNLVSALRTQESHFPQIFLISHISEIQGEFSTSLLVKMKDDWNSEIIEVS